MERRDRESGYSGKGYYVKLFVEMISFCNAIWIVILSLLLNVSLPNNNISNALLTNIAESASVDSGWKIACRLQDTKSHPYTEIGGRRLCENKKVNLCYHCKVWTTSDFCS